MAEPAHSGTSQARGRGATPVVGGPHFPGDLSSQPHGPGRTAPVPRPGELTCVTLGPGRETARNGMPDSAIGPGREAAVAAGLYGGEPDREGWFRQGLSRPELRPDVPGGEVDSWSQPDPVTALRRAGFLRRAPKAEPAAEPEAG